MDIITAIETRKSIRAYLKKPVPMEIIEKILETSVRSPSATNIQPWNIYVVTGKVLENIKHENVDLFFSGIRPTIEEPILQEIYKQRRKELAIDLFKLLDIKREDADKRKEWTARGYEYFDAPVALIFTINKEILGGTWSLLGIGSIIQTICLAAMNYDLGTCISEQGVSYHHILRKNIGIPEEEHIVISLALGYPDQNAPANQLVSGRAPLSDVTHWLGF